MNMKLHFYDQYGNKLEGLTQWDSNVIIKIPEYPHIVAPIFHFTNKTTDESLTTRSHLRDGVVTVVVPNVLLTRSRPIDVFVFHYDSASDEGRTVYYERLAVRQKQKPNDFEYVDNTDVIEVSTLSARLETIVAETELAISTRIGDLDDKIGVLDGKVETLDSEYAAQVQAIKDAIQSDADNLNQSIAQNRDTLSGDIARSRTTLENDIAAAKQALIASVADGSPRGVFTDAAELASLPSGVYLLNDAEDEHNGWIYYWDGEALSDPLVYYAGIVLNRGDVHFETLDDSLKRQCIITVIPYTLDAEDWEDGEQEIDLGNNYVVTSKTLVDINQDSAMYYSLQQEGCFGIYVTNNAGTLTAIAMGQSPTDDLTVQLTIQETI